MLDFPPTQPTQPALPAHATKPWWRSRTLMFNAACAGLATAEASYNLLQPLMPINAYAALAFVLPVGNAVLRALTTKGLTK